jgi:hypothetical protein
MPAFEGIGFVIGSYNDALDDGREGGNAMEAGRGGTGGGGVGRSSNDDLGSSDWNPRKFVVVVVVVDIDDARFLVVVDPVGGSGFRILVFSFGSA